MRGFGLFARALIAALAVTMTSSLAPAQFYPHAPYAPPSAPRHAAHIYLLKGLADVFSSGMDSLAAKLRQRGITARVASHASSDSLADEVARLYRAGSRAPVIIAGHSLGADAAVSMAQRLNQFGVPVALVITFGPLHDPSVPANVARAVNYYQSQSAWHGQLMRGAGFRGSLANINLDKAPEVNHFNIEKVDRTQNQAISSIVAAINGGRRPIRGGTGITDQATAPAVSPPARSN
jgi:pimeloyl-ACP methyl ester carboxylesterase